MILPVADTSEPPVLALLQHAAGVGRRTMRERLTQERWLVEAGFRPPCIGALTVISTRQPLSQRELSEALRLDPSDTVDVLDILERAGFVARRRDPADRRRHALTLTPAGTDANARIGVILRELEDELLAPLGARDRRALRTLLQRIVRHAEAGGTDAG